MHNQHPYFIAKDHPRVEAGGCIDELNTFVGAVRTGLGADSAVADAIRQPLDDQLYMIQERLDDLCDYFAAPADRKHCIPGAETVRTLQSSIEEMQGAVRKGGKAILPGGVPTNARLHMCRAICDRAERRVAAIERLEPVPEDAVAFLSKLSAWFLTAARVVANGAGKEWEYDPVSRTR